MSIKPIRNDDDLQRAFKRLEKIFQAEEGTSRDLEPYIGQSGRVSEVLNRKRALSLRMVKRLHDGLRIPYESLLAGVR